MRELSSDATNEVSSSPQVQERLKELRQHKEERYPRWPADGIANEYNDIKHGAQPRIAIASLAMLKAGHSIASLRDESYESGKRQLGTAGRIIHIRKSGRKLAFVDIANGSEKLQVIIWHGRLLPEISEDQFVEKLRLLRRGDHISVRGHATTTRQDHHSLNATEFPVLLAPCLQRLPLRQSLSERNTEQEFTVGRHVEMLSFPSMADTIKLRAMLIRRMRVQFDGDGFTEVQTPILAAAAGGASARPFITTATEFSNRKLALRIAPELWLKRLMVGGMDKVYEIGPSFRNEGLDKTHNPEFTTCEFYVAHLNIEQLIAYTEIILRGVATHLSRNAPPIIPEKAIFSEFRTHPDKGFPRLDFIPALSEALGEPLPSLMAPSARVDIISLFTKHDIPVPEPPTLPRLLDKLSSHFLESQCHTPTWIINPPECLSPLSKSFTHPTAPNNQTVAARAELFVRSKEIVNCYEEENSPFEQRRKFVDQQRYSHVDDSPASNRIDDEAMQVDEDYIRALEWGLPPTGGWGCGIDRLVMLMTGLERIGDVLSFGNLRAVTRGAEKMSEPHSPAPPSTNVQDVCSEKAKDFVPLVKHNPLFDFPDPKDEEADDDERNGGSRRGGSSSRVGDAPASDALEKLQAYATRERPTARRGRTRASSGRGDARKSMWNKGRG